MDDAVFPLQPPGDDAVAKELIKKELEKAARKQFMEHVREEEIQRKRLKELGWAFLAGFVSSVVFYGIFRSCQASNSNPDQ